MVARPAGLALLLLAGLALVAWPLAAPATPPPDRVEYRVDEISGPVDSWERLQYENLSGPPKAAVDDALAGGSDTRNVTVPANGSLPPLANATHPVVAYEFRHDGQWYLLEVSHFDPEVPASAEYRRVASLLGGLLLVLVAAYRAVTG